MATGRPAWQVLAAAMGTGQPVTDVLYAGAPFGVAYLVAQFDANHAAKLCPGDWPVSLNVTFR